MPSLNLRVGLGGQLSLADQPGGRIAPRHVDFDQSQLVGHVEFLVVQEFIQFGRSMNLERLVRVGLRRMQA